MEKNEMDLQQSSEQPKKVSRKSYKSQMTELQEAMLKRYFTEKSQKPNHQEKKQLAEKSGVDPFLMNKWFQRERNRLKKKDKPAAKIRKSKSQQQREEIQQEASI